MNFSEFKAAVAAQFARMSKYALFRTAATGDDLWATYLGSFPEGSNPMYRERTEHDCSCCKQFIRAVGNVVAIIDGRLVSLWDFDEFVDPGYQVVANALAAAVKAKPIEDVFLHFERTAGTDKNFEQLVTGQRAWEHFFVHVPAQFVKPAQYIPSTLGEIRSKREVMFRGLVEIRPDALDSILELISQGSLYRGEEHKHAVVDFQKLQREFARAADQNLFTWAKVQATPNPVAAFRNTVIGTLAVDISDGVELDRAVAAFEAKVAPANYKRPTAVVTKAMIENARKTVEDLGLTSALHRRYATLADITVNNILFANRDTKKVLGGDVFEDLASSVAVKPKAFDKVEDVPIEKFIADILPQATSVEVLVENRHASRLVSLIAPGDPTAPGLFKWGNGFSWSYNGDMADSIKERVKKAGGNVEGDLCCRLSWDYTDDLDFHMHEPDGVHIYYGNRRAVSRNGGMLDVDANGIDGVRPDPCENIFYATRLTMRDGVYRLKVQNYNRRSNGVGFEVEIEFDGQVHHLALDRVVRDGETVEVADITLSKGVFSLNALIPSTTTSKEHWGIKTQTFQPVSVIMKSPNYWDDQVGIGNKHYFFMLDGCRNDGSARGFFNEFLKGDLDQHRKVLEMVGSKMKTEESPNQLSGLGFSSTQRDHLTVRVKGSFTRVINLTF